MGSSNVVCSVSNISMGCGTECYFIPLLPNVYAPTISLRASEEEKRIAKLNTPHYVGNNSQLIYPYCYYWPFSLPIKGKYNDYGRIEDIVEDSNTKSIEEYFGINIDKFIDFVTHESAEEHFNIHKFKYSSDTKLTPSSILKIGFKEIVESSVDVFDAIPDEAKREFYHPKFEKILVILREHTISDEDEHYHDSGNYNYEIYTDLDECAYKSPNNSYYAYNEFRKHYRELTKFIINVPEDKQHIVQLLDGLSGMFVHAKVYDKLAEGIKEDYENPQSVAETYAQEYQLENLGFRKVKKEEQVFQHPHHDTLWRKDDFEYDIFLGNYGGGIVHQSEKQYAVLGDKRFVSETRNIWEKLTGTKPSQTFPEPELKTGTSTATDGEWKAICDKFFELTGIKVGWAKTTKNFYKLIGFKKEWEELTSDILDIGEYESKNKTYQEYEDLQQAILEFEEKKKLPPTIETRHYGSDEEQRDTYARLQRLSRMLPAADREMEEFVLNPPGEAYTVKIQQYDLWDDPFGTFSRDKYKFYQFFKDWDYFVDLYQKAIVAGELKEEFKQYKNFYWSMYSTNNHFFPAMNGEQCGNHRASKILYETALEIVNEELQDYEE